MLATRSTHKVSAVIVAAGACLLLGACGGSSNGSSSGSGSSSSSSGGSSSTVAPTKGLLTGDFCKDFITLGKDVSPTAAQEKKLNSDRPAAADLMSQIAADFDGLGKEAPPKIQKAMHTIASQYAALGETARSGKSLSDLKKQASTLTTGGASGAAFKKLTTYMETSCI